MVQGVGNGNPTAPVKKTEEKKEDKKPEAQQDKPSSPKPTTNTGNTGSSNLNQPTGGLDPKAAFDVSQGLKDKKSTGNVSNTGTTDNTDGTQTDAASGTSTEEGKLLVNGQKPVGVNALQVVGDYDSKAYLSAEELKKLNPDVNFVRVGIYDKATPEEIAKTVKDNADHGIVSFIEPFADKNKVQTNNNGGQLTPAYLERVKEITRAVGNDPMVVMGTGNELNGSNDIEAWKNNNAEVIKAMYEAGYPQDKDIHVDAPNWGQNPKGAAENFQALKAMVGTDSNIVINVHAYGAAKNADFKQGLDELQASGNPWLIGESGGEALNQALDWGSEYDIAVLPWLGVDPTGSNMSLFTQNTDLASNLTDAGRSWLNYATEFAA